MRFMSGGLNEEGEDQTGENKMQEVFFFFVLETSGRKCSMEEQVGGLSFYGNKPAGKRL